MKITGHEQKIVVEPFGNTFFRYCFNFITRFIYFFVLRRVLPLGIGDTTGRADTGQYVGIMFSGFITAFGTDHRHSIKHPVLF